MLDFWAELNTVNHRHPRLVTGAVVEEDNIPNPEDEDDLDDNDVSLRDVIAVTHQEPVTKQHRRCTSLRENGGLTTVTDAEQLEEMPKPLKVEEEGRGKRKKTANTLYRLSDFTRHWDNEGSDVE
jgi:hypothetical protein